MRDAARRTGWVPRDIGAGIFLMLIAAIGIMMTGDLGSGDSVGIGPGLMPLGVSGLLALVGIVVLIGGVSTRNETVSLGSLRGPVFVLGAVALFAATVRPLGLAIAGPIAVVISALADPQSKPLEIAIFTVAITTFCVLLFKYALRLPIPLAPILLGY
jgi:putative tricarboxylic transport membrane protein